MCCTSQDHSQSHAKSCNKQLHVTPVPGTSSGEDYLFRVKLRYKLFFFTRAAKALDYALSTMIENCQEDVKISQVLISDGGI